MKLISLIIALGAPLLFRTDAPVTTDNPGHLDNPACVHLIETILTNGGGDPANFDIRFSGSDILPDGATQDFILINKVTGKVVDVSVIIKWRNHEGPAPAPSPVKQESRFKESTVYGLPPHPPRHGENHSTA